MNDYVTKRELEDTVDKQFAAQRQKFEFLREDFSSLQAPVLQYAKDVEKYHDEAKARDLEQLAAQAGLKLEY